MSKRTSKQTDPEVTCIAAHETIRKNYANIERTVSVESILPKLFARKVIGEYEKQEIEAGKTQFQKSHTLADSMTRKSGKQFEEFYGILEETRVYAEFAHALRSQYAEEIAMIEARKGRGAVERSQEGTCVCVCLCEYCLYPCMYIYVCLCVHVCMHVHLYECMYVCSYMHLLVFVIIRIFVCVYLCLCAHVKYRVCA